MTDSTFEGYIKEPKREESYLDMPENPRPIKKLTSDNSYSPSIYGYDKDIYNKKWHNFLIGFFIIASFILIIGGWYFLGMIQEGKLQSTLTNNINPSFNATVINSYNDTTQNTYTNNFFNNFTLVIDKINIVANTT